MITTPESKILTQFGKDQIDVSKIRLSLILNTSNDTILQRPAGCFGAVANFQLGQHVADVNPHCTMAERELLSDLFVGLALSNEHEYLALAFG